MPRLIVEARALMCCLAPADDVVFSVDVDLPAVDGFRLLRIPSLVVGGSELRHEFV